MERTNELGFTVHEVVTLASIIEGEALLDQERVTISSVYHNRLKKRMKLIYGKTSALKLILKLGDFILLWLIVIIWYFN